MTSERIARQSDLRLWWRGSATRRQPPVASRQSKAENNMQH
jgi:hypothetical protein